MCTIAAQHAAPVLLLVALVSSDSAAADAAAFSEHGASTLTPSCTVTSHGARGDNRTEDTHAVQAALDSCATVVFSAPGKYLIRPVFFRHSGLSVVIEPGATIVAWGDIDTWNTTSPKISALFCQDPGRATDPLRNFSLTGGGVIDGQGWRWWPFLKTRSRPELLSLYRVEGALISGITFRDSPSFHVSVRGYDIEIAHSRVEANIESCLGWDHAPNTDAFNIGGGNIHLHDLWVHNGDDCIPTNPGPDGYTSNVLVENIHCECGTNGGVIIVPGSRGVPPLDWQAGGPDTHPKIVANVTYRNMSVHHTNQGAGFKISEAYENVSGMAQNVTWEDIEIYKPRNTAIYMNVFTEDASEAACKVAKDAESRGSTWLTAHDFTFKNIAATTDGFPGCLLCSPTNPCKGITFDNVTVRSTNSTAEFICFNAHGESHDSSPDPSCLKAAHGPAHEPVQQLEAARSWVMTFEDDFAGDALNASSWTVSDHDKTISQYDGHDALFIKERVMVAGGYLAITTVNEANTLDGVSYNFTSGWIDSKQKVNQSLLAAPTRWEASMKMASAEANGAWPAWWLLPEGECWPISGEVDIVEVWLGQGHYQHSHVGQPVAMASTYHYGYGCSEDKSKYDIDSNWYPSLNYSATGKPIDFSADFHTFGVEINDTSLRFYVDDVTTFVRTLPQLCVSDPEFVWGETAYMPWKPMYGIINVAVAQNTKPSVWWASNNATTLVDWVRMYTLEAKAP